MLLMNQETTLEVCGSGEVVSGSSVIFSFSPSRTSVVVCYEKDLSTGYNFSIFELWY